MTRNYNEIINGQKASNNFNGLGKYSYKKLVIYNTTLSDKGLSRP